MIKAEIVADSKNEFGNRLTTFVITFPRIILAEFNTHRMLSKNTASSRAIPFDKMMKSVMDNPFIPIAWQRDHKGMQGTEYFTDPEEIANNVFDHLNARDAAVAYAKSQKEKGITKQVCNRYLEPFSWCTMIVSGTEFENFFHLRCPRYEMPTIHKGVYRSVKDFKKGLGGSLRDDLDNTLGYLSINKGQAEIHMMALAEAMWDAYNESTPKQLKAGEWHIPYENKILPSELIECAQGLGLVDPPDASHKWLKVRDMLMVKVSTFMAARTSYTVVGDDLKPMSYAKMIENHDKLAVADPVHASPFEHCGRNMTAKELIQTQKIFVINNGELEDWMKEDIKNNLGHYDEHNGVPAIFRSYGWSGNFRGFKQYRKMIPNENKV